MPIRLYQIGRKYRDELRPRAGLLRGREFIMKDLYSFDQTVEDAFESYEEVTGAYKRIFERLGVPFVIVKYNRQTEVYSFTYQQWIRLKRIVEILVDRNHMNTTWFLL